MPTSLSFQRRWGRVDAARKHLEAQALQAAKLAIAAARVAAKKGDAGPAQWLLSHTEITDPDSKQSIRPIASSVDKQAQELAQGINVRVGIALGDRSSQPVTVIEGSVSNPQQIGPGSCAEPSQTRDE